MYLTFSLILSKTVNNFALTVEILEVGDTTSKENIPVFNEGPGVTFIPAWAITDEGKVTLLNCPCDTSIILAEGKQSTIKYPIELSYEPSTSYSSDPESRTSSDIHSESSNEETKEENLDTMPSPNEILSDVQLLINDCSTKKEVSSRMLTFIGELIPREVFVNDLEELRNPNSSLNLYLEDFRSKTDILTTEGLASLLNFQVGCSTYNALLLVNRLHETDTAEYLYFSTLEKMLASK